MWQDWPEIRNEIVTQPRGNIHPRMIEMLKEAGREGVPWQDFQDFPTRRAKFDKKWVDDAMREISRHYGCPLQFTGSRDGGHHPDRYRIAEGWDHDGRIGTHTTLTDFSSVVGK